VSWGKVAKGAVRGKKVGIIRGDNRMAREEMKIRDGRG